MIFWRKLLSFLSKLSHYKPSMPNHYDRIFKENIEPMIPFIARKLFGIKEIKQSEDIKDKLQYTLEKEADYLFQDRPHWSPTSQSQNI
jgi:hypothetical protein